MIPKTLRDQPRWLVWKYNAEQKKIPYQAAHPELEAKVNDEATWSDYATAEKSVEHADGLGIVLGSGLAGVDLDDCRDPQTGALKPSAKAIIEALDTYTEVSPSATGVKLYINAWLGKNHARPGLEIYGGRRYFCVTGQHLAGTPEEPQARGTELAALVAKEFHHQEDSADDAEPDAVENVPADDATELIEGGRNNALAKLGGSLRRLGLSDDEISATLHTFNRNRCKPPLERSEVDAIANSIARYAPSKAERAIDWMNAKHAVLKENGKTIIITEDVDPVLKRRVIERSAAVDIRLFYCDSFVTLKVPGGKSVKKQLGDYWLAHPGRRKYSRIVFDPEKTHPPDVFNLWTGFALTPRQGSWSRLRDHLHGIIAGGRSDVFSYWLGWLARAVQKPGRPGEVALVMRGPQGAGKGLLARSLGHIFGQHFVHLARAHHLTGHFNAHLQDAALVFADEAVWGGDKSGEGALKALITEPTLPIERKGRDAYVVKNVIHLLLASNADWAVPAGIDDRRFCVVDVLPDRVGDHGYFNAIVKEMANGGLEAMLYELLHHDLAKFNHRQVPKTEALLHQKMLGMAPTHKWWFDKLKAGQLLAWHDRWHAEVSRRELHDDYVQVLQKVGITRRSTETELAYDLKHLVPGLDSVRRTVNVRALDGARFEKRFERCWIVQPLDVCRRYFQDSVIKQKLEWDETAVAVPLLPEEKEY